MSKIDFGDIGAGTGLIGTDSLVVYTAQGSKRLPLSELEVYIESLP